ncbi:4'-phosphopantetheinyl transferase family protein [Methylocystis sp.]|uniref:4'-phosphopantetheinyl transferase family protein n=1 Tax=Methylocystis sp. TaxID=1911079 RepID=UPI003DA1D993
MQKRRISEITVVDALKTSGFAPGITAIQCPPAPPQSDASLPLPIDRVDCWWVSSTAAPADSEGMLRKILSTSELERAERFRFEDLRASYVGHHAALRLIIARYLQTSPAALLFTRETNGRPILASPAGRLHFNLSHSGCMAFIAFSCIAPLGVDVEEVREVPDFEEIARNHFAPTEVEGLFRVPDAQKLLAFYVTWTRKEAFVKALGLGLSFPLDGFSTGRPDRPPSLHLQGTPLITEWTVVDLAPSARYMASLAIRHPNVPIRCWRAEWSWLLNRVQGPR